MNEPSLGLWERLKIYAIPTTIVLIGVVISLVLYWQLRVLDKQRINEQFTQIAQKQSRHLQWNLTNYRNALHTTVDLFNSAERVELNEFRRIANLIQNRYPEVLALEWLPKVSNQERNQFVQNIRKQYGINYQITELGNTGKIVKAQNRETYYPVTYVQPFQSAPYNRQFLGFDHLSLVNRRQAIQKARNQGSITMTPSTVFLRTGQQERSPRSPDNNLGVILYKPVFETPGTDDNVEEQHEKPVGVIALSLKIQSVMGPVFEDYKFAHNVAIFEHTSNPNNPKSRLIYTTQPPEKIQEVTGNSDRISFQERFPASDRSWSVLIWPTQQHLNKHKSWGPLMALGFGLLLTGIMTRGSYWFSGEFLGRRREFQSVVDSAEDAIITIDESDNIQLWNKAAGQIFQYKQNEIIEKPISQIIAENDREGFLETLNSHRYESDDSSGQTVELRGEKADGTTFPIELTLARWEQQGEVLFTVIIRDVTERKNREQRLEELTRNLEEKVRKRTEELEQFVYAASHDLREPARVMETYAGFLEDDLDDQLDSDVRKDLRFIRNSAAQMNELIDSLLTLSRIGQGEIEPEPVDVSTCVDQALEQQEELIQTSDVTIQWDELPRVKADPALLTDLYQNLLSNAIKHNENGSVKIHLTAEKVDGDWILGVKDNGPGIKPEFQDKIFEPFKHLQQSDQQDGTGIGLSICRRIVERHDGEIWVESENGEGAHFRFTLGQNKVS